MKEWPSQLKATYVEIFFGKIVVDVVNSELRSAEFAVAKNLELLRPFPVYE